MLVKTYGAAVQGIDATLISIEVSISSGVRFFLVGLPDSAIKESHERILSAFAYNKYPFPRKQVIINLSPADIRKAGSAYDLPIAIGILAASDVVRTDKLPSYAIMGELSLDGTLLPIRGALPVAIKIFQDGFKGIVLPSQNAREAAVIDGLEVYAADNLQQVVGFFNGTGTLERVTADIKSCLASGNNHQGLDFADVKGQESVKRAMEVAAAGGHNILLIGPPGSGKSMLAKRLPSILPPLSFEEALETTKIHSVAGKLGKTGSLLTDRPFRSPHHTISDIALVGGGSFPQPGEISLAHNGVLFLDELPEFKRQALEVLRQPLEDRRITVSRSLCSVDYPAGFMLVASMNPCPCGYFNHPTRECVCPHGAVRKYLNRISGPLLDRIDMHVEIVPVDFESMSQNRPAESSSTVRERVIRARGRQSARFKDMAGIYCNAQMDAGLLHRTVRPDKKGLELLQYAMDKLQLSARAYDRILRVSRTIADLDDSDEVSAVHVSEAIGYRNLDRATWDN